MAACVLHWDCACQRPLRQSALPLPLLCGSGSRVSIKEISLITGDSDPVSSPHISTQSSAKQGALSNTSKSLTFHPYHSQATARVLSKLLRALFGDSNRVSSLWTNLEGILQCVSTANVKDSGARFTWLCGRVRVCASSAWFGLQTDEAGTKPGGVKCITVCPPAHSNTYVPTQPDRHDVTPSAPTEREMSAVWQCVGRPR